MSDIKEICLFPEGAVDIPPSKSAAHRAIICAALADGVSRIDNISDSQDIAATIDCMNGLGAKCSPCCSEPGRGALSITGGLSKQADTLDCGESGSTLRFLVPVAALLPGEISFTGKGRLMERPLGPYLDALTARGAGITLDSGVLTVRGPLQAGTYTIPGDISSQFVSGLLFALPLLSEDSEIVIETPLQSSSYVDLTLDVIAGFGVRIENDGFERFRVKGGQRYRARSFSVESDYSQAAFFLVASALGRECECLGLSSDSKQGDRAILKILKDCGAEIIKTARGGITVKARKLTPLTVDVSDIPDLVPPLAVLLSFCEGTSRIINAGRLRHKESDRLGSVTAGLNAIGADITEGDDYLVVRGVKSFTGGLVDSCGDHRIAMMAAVAAIMSKGSVSVTQSACVAKSYPGFWTNFEKTNNTEVHSIK